MDTFCTYEQYYGLSGLPFAATTELGFYFESRGHHRAFAYVRHALLEGDCFIVLTGETGSGKTMLVRKLLAGLQADGIVAAQPTGTGLGANEVLQAVLLAFNAPAIGSSVDESRTELRAFLAALAATGRRGLAVFDEAQHLLPGAIDALIEMAKPQSVDGAALQVLLIGQPKLRASIPNAANEPRQPFFLVCDIGPLSQAETRAYIEHRLRRVQWNESPSFSDAAHEQIYRATEGVPRRINRLCHRVLMAAAGHQQKSISAELVDETHAALREEMGGSVAAPVALASQPVQAPPARAALRVSRPTRSAIPTLFAAPADEEIERNRASEKTPQPEAIPIPTLTSVADDSRTDVAPPADPDADLRDSAIPTLFSVVDVQPSAERAHPPALESSETHVFIEEIPKRGSRVRWIALVCVLVAGVLTTIWLDYEHEKSSAVSVSPRTTPARSVAGNVETATEPLPPASRAEPSETLPAAPHAVTPEPLPAPPPAVPTEPPPAAPVFAKPEPARTEALARMPEKPRAGQRAPDARIRSAQLGSKSGRKSDTRPIPQKPVAVSQPCTPAIAAMGLCTPSSTQ